VAERVCKLVKAEAPPGVYVTCDYDPSIPDIQADPDQLIQAMLNITRNAVQALQGQGEIILRTRVQRQVVIGHRRYRLAVRMDVIDNGPGIPADMMEKVFYPMVSGRPGGTGLGLSIAQSLVHQHGGTIQCTSRPSETVMSLLLPLEEPE
jgi:two-component system, NtrC family, nitrogen regulation sensor histidine kinase GlnL